MRNTTTYRVSERAGRLYDLSWYAVRPVITSWAEKAHISTYGQAEVFLAGINGAESAMRCRMSVGEKRLADIVYRLGQFAQMVSASGESPAARIGMIAAGRSLRQLGAGSAAEKIYLAARKGF